MSRSRVLLAAVFLAVSACARGDDASSSRGAAFHPLDVGDRAPAYAVRTLAGDTVRVGNGAPVLLNVWATWCTSCREEMQDLAAIHRAYAPRGVRVVAVSVDAGDGARVRRYAESERLPFAVAHDPAGEVERAFQTVGVPETYLISAEGKLLWLQRGGLHGGLDAARAALDRAAAPAR